MTFLKKLQWFMLGALLVLYCVQFYQLHQREVIYQHIIDEQKKMRPAQWVQKEQCWPSSMGHMNEMYDFLFSKMQNISDMQLNNDEDMKRHPIIMGNCVYYWERIS